MRELPMQFLVLATFLTILLQNCASLTEDDSGYTADEKQIMIQNLEKFMLTRLGIDKLKPVTTEDPLVVPDNLLQLYNNLRNMDQDTVAIPKHGIHSNTANTVRSYTHAGKRLITFSKFKVFCYLEDSNQWQTLLKSNFLIF